MKRDLIESNPVIEISTGKADQLSDDKPVTGVIIKITGQLPKHETLEAAEAYYQEGAEVIADALCDALPQGTRYRLMLELWERYVKHNGYYRGR